MTLCSFFEVHIAVLSHPQYLQYVHCTYVHVHMFTMCVGATIYVQARRTQKEHGRTPQPVLSQMPIMSNQDPTKLE
jgi:hypothetical protein